MAGFRSRAESFTLNLSNSPMDVVPSAVLSPITELSKNFEENTISMTKTPKRKLSMCNVETPNTPNPSPFFMRTLSNESGYFPSSPVAPSFDSPTLEVLKSSSTQRPFHLSKPLFKRWNSSPAGPVEDDNNNKENIPSGHDLPDDTKTKEEFIFTRPRVPSFVRRFSVPAKTGERPVPSMPWRSLSDPLGETSDWQPSVLSPTRLSDSQDSACDVDFDEENSDDGFIDAMVHDHDHKDDNAGMPSGIFGLISAPLVSKKSPEQINVLNPLMEKTETPKQMSESRPRPRELFSTAEDSPGRCRANTQTTTDDDQKQFVRPRSKSFALKRPNPPRDPHPMEKKRLRQRCMSLVENNTLMPSPLLTSRVSFKHKSPLKRSNSEVFEHRPDFSFLTHGNKKMIGDFSGPYTLPFIETGCQHQDLVGITPETVSRVINGEFDDTIEAHIIDCRYPFEYVGGHIKGALNIYRKEDMYEEYLKKPKQSTNKKIVLIFHCEFSSKRGPDMCRFLRNRDRDLHGKDYPALYYPELYLLEGGYKNFFSSQKEHCEPQDYVLMIDEKHSEDLKLFSKRSKSWSAGHGKKTFRPGLNYR